MNTVAPQPMYGWNTIPWKKVERVVFKLQKRIYRAQLRGDVKTVRQLQKLLMKSRSTKLLAVRRVTQDNQGKKTAGVDGVKSLPPEARLELAQHLRLSRQAQPVRRVTIPKPGSQEQRPLGIPTITDRARQALAKMALEPQWEALFEPNSYGFRPGRSAWDAIGAIYVAINQKAKWVLDADIAKCFDRINHAALLRKLNTFPTIRRQIDAWLKAGVMEQGGLFPTETGTPQGGVISPLLANVALHGLEHVIHTAFPAKRQAPILVRYADDLVIMHPQRSVIEQCQMILSAWLAEMGLELKPSKTRIAHTLEAGDGPAGFDFLGFNIRQYKAPKRRLGFKTIIKPSRPSLKKHHLRIREVIAQHRMAGQIKLITALNLVIRGWSKYYQTVCSKQTLSQADHTLISRLRAWARFRHPNKTWRWRAHKYWKREGHKLYFAPKNSTWRLRWHSETRIKRHVKIQGERSPYDGDWVYWSERLGRHPEVSTRVAKLLKRQKGKCTRCGLQCKDGDMLEVDHIIPREYGGKDGYNNWQLLHRHCHDEKTAEDCRRYARQAPGY